MTERQRLVLGVLTDWLPLGLVGTAVIKNSMYGPEQLLVGIAVLGGCHVILGIALLIVYGRLIHRMGRFSSREKLKLQLVLWAGNMVAMPIIFHFFLRDWLSLSEQSQT